MHIRPVRVRNAATRFARAISADQQAEVRDKIKDGETISAIARHFETSRQTIMRVRNQG
tara:strand:- start:3201 stop:3377 length:177 start_codon:yes stop_codon:yes gene_type:complete